MSNTLTYRYPGAKPFSSEEEAIFFGRGEDVRKLKQLILLERLVVLHGRSGLGKSSLLNAGVIPRLKKEEGQTTFTIRFGAWYEGREGDPLTITKSHLQLQPESGHYLDELLPGDESLWEFFKVFQHQNPGKRSYVVIFDQFEELFTWPKQYINAFKRQLSELLYVDIPQRFRAMLEAQTYPLNREEQESIYQSLDIRIVLVIRSDRLSLMDQLSDIIPEILHHRYELKALSPLQAEDAILNPAFSQDEGFLSPPFDYADEALDDILDHLTRSGTEEIESFQLQIICQHAENLARTGISRISPEDLGDLDHIFNNYYNHQLELLNSEEEEIAARKLIEEGLIFDEEGQERRLALYEGLINSEYGVSPDLLSKLVSTHLIRSEPDPRGGFIYELSHDSLIHPILKAKRIRQFLEEKERMEEETRRKELEQAEELKKQRAVIAEQRKVRNYQRIIIIGLMLAGAAMTVFAIWAFRQKNKLDREVYNNFIASGNLLLQIEQFDQAISQFEQAEYIGYNTLGDLEGEEAGFLIQESKVREQKLKNFNEFLRLGDSLLQEGAYNNAKNEYTLAISVNYSTIKNEMAENRLKSANTESNAAFTRFKEKGRRFYNVREYRLSYNNFLKAREIQPNNEYVNSRISDCERILRIRN